MDKLFKINRTHIGAIRIKQNSQLEEVCKLLQWSHEEYCEHQFKQYERFMFKLAFTLPELRDRIRYSPVFRGFWNNKWAERNFEWLQYAYDSSEKVTYITEEYEFMHDAMRLIHSDEVFYNQFENILKMI